MQSKYFYKVMTVLGNKTRLQILEIIVQHNQQGITPGEIAHRMDLACNTVSFHLGKLTDVALCEYKRNGKQLIYKIKPGAIKIVCSNLLNTYACDGQICRIL